MGKWILPSNQVKKDILDHAMKNHGYVDESVKIEAYSVAWSYDKSLLIESLDLLEQCLCDLSHTDVLSMEINSFLSQFKPQQDDTRSKKTD